MIILKINNDYLEVYYDGLEDIYDGLEDISERHVWVFFCLSTIIFLSLCGYVSGIGWIAADCGTRQANEPASYQKPCGL